VIPNGSLKRNTRICEQEMKKGFARTFMYVEKTFQNRLWKMNIYLGKKLLKQKVTKRMISNGYPNAH